MLVRTLSCTLALLAAPLGSALVAPDSTQLISNAEAAFGGKIKNIRIRERHNTQGYRVIVIVKNDNDNEVRRAEVTVANDDGSNPVTIDVTDISKSVDRHTWEGFLFEDGAVGLVYPATIALQTGDQVRATVGVDGWMQSANQCCGSVAAGSMASGSLSPYPWSQKSPSRSSTA